jgi:hypothetical protein
MSGFDQAATLQAADAVYFARTRPARQNLRAGLQRCIARRAQVVRPFIDLN